MKRKDRKALRKLEKQQQRRAASAQIQGSSPPQSSPAPSPVPVPDKPRWQRVWWFVKLNWQFLSVVLAVLSFVSYVTLLPRISVEAGPTLNAKEAFQTRFILKNDSAFTIYNVTYSFEWYDGVNPKIWINGMDIGLVDKIPPGGRFSMRVDYSHLMPTKGALFQIDAHYRYPWCFWQQRQSDYFQFLTKRDVESNFVWLPWSGNRWTPTNAPRINLD